MGEAIGEIAVVGEEEQALGVGVETPHREHPRLGRHQRDDGGTALGVAGRRHHAAGLVEEVVDEVVAGRHRHAVDFDPVDGRVDAAAEGRLFSVDRDPAPGDELLAGPPAAEAGPGQHLLQALALLLAGIHSLVRSPCSRASTTSEAGTKSPSEGRSSSESSPSFSRNMRLVP